MANILSLRTAIKNKLNSLTGSGQPLAIIFEYHTLDNNGQFPYATFEPSSLSSEYLDTSSNLRQYTFDIFLYQEITQNGRNTALGILLNAFDAIINTFDADFTLGGLAEGGVNPILGEFGQLISGDGKILFVNLKLVCKSIKTI